MSSPRVGLVADFIGAGWTYEQMRANLRARRWQQIGRAIVAHNGQLTLDDKRQVGLALLGPRAVLTSFTALAE